MTTSIASSSSTNDLQQYNDLQSHVRELIAQMKLAQQRKQPVELMGLGI